MQYPGYNTGENILSEGNWYPFKIHNIVQLQDDDWYYVLQDVNGLKHFMQAGFYETYGFKLGEVIMCKIDRINCTGRIYLEPENPHYKEGENYYFETTCMLNSDDKNLLVVKDISGNTVEVPLYDNSDLKFGAGKMIRCNVKSIKKGMLSLEINNINH